MLDYLYDLYDTYFKIFSAKYPGCTVILACVFVSASVLPIVDTSDAEVSGAEDGSLAVIAEAEETSMLSFS